MSRKSMVGKTIGGKLHVVSVLGEGGVGVVYLAEHEVLERLFAVKVLRREMASDHIAVERFHREARAASRLQHRNIVYISDFGQLPDHRFYLVMEYIPGQDLGAVLGNEGPLTLVRCCRVMLQVLDAVAYAHEQGVVHRDLKPENILLAERRGQRDLVKVLDFGLAKLLFGKQSPITFKGQMFGTPECMAPEQIAGGEVDNRVDVYALGVLTFELLTGRPPFTGRTMEQLMAHRKVIPPRPSAVAPKQKIPPSLDALVARAMAKQPAERFGSVGQMAAVFRAVLADPEWCPEVLEQDGVELVPAGFRPGAVLRSPAADRPPAGPAGAKEHPTAPIGAGYRYHPEPEKADDRATVVQAGNALQDLPATKASPAPGDSSTPQKSTESADTKRGGDKEGTGDKGVRHGGAWVLSSATRRRFYRMAQALRDEGVGGPQLTQKLARCLECEERLLEHSSEVSSLNARIRELEAAGRERESRLRYAIIDLSMERGRVDGASKKNATQKATDSGQTESQTATEKPQRGLVADLEYQIRELEQRLRRVAEQREADLSRLEDEIRRHRRAADALRETLLERERVLARALLAHRADLRAVRSAEGFCVKESMLAELESFVDARAYN